MWKFVVAFTLKGVFHVVIIVFFSVMSFLSLRLLV